MIGKGPRFERETVINFNEAEPMASIWTASEIVYRRLRNLGYHPAEDEERHAAFTVPKSVVKVLGPRAKRERTEAQREALRKAQDARKSGRSRSGGIAAANEERARGAEDA